MFKYNPKCCFIKTDKYEQFKSNYRNVPPIIGHYHLKLCKKNRGYDNYNLSEYKSRYYEMFKDIVNINNKFILFNNEVIKKLKLQHTPFDLGFYFINKSQKIHKLEEFNVIEKNFKI